MLLGINLLLLLKVNAARHKLTTAVENDEKGMDCLPNATIFEELTRIGHEKLSQKLSFYKAFFSPQWKFLIHTILQCLGAKTTAWNEFSSTMWPKQKDTQERKIHDIDVDEDITLENVHDVEMFDVNDLHGDEVFVEKKVPVKEVSAVVKVNTASITTIVSAATITEDEITLAQALVELKSVKPKVTTATTTTTKGILLQEPSESITTTTTTTIPSKDKGKGIMVEEPLKMKKKDQINFDEQEAIRLQDEFDKEERLAREKNEANIALTEEWNDIQAKIETDYELAQRLQADKQEELNVDEKATMFQQLLKKRRKHFAAKRAEEKRNRPLQELNKGVSCRVNTFVDFRTELVEGTEMEEGSKKAEVMEESSKKVEIAQESSSKRAGDELEQENANKQKVDDDQEATKIKELMKIIPGEEEVAVDAIPLATKPLSIVDWKIVKE
ncbi:hypothetical protein Tco_1459302 [Tanacetum coccineum]